MTHLSKLNNDTLCWSLPTDVHQVTNEPWCALDDAIWPGHRSQGVGILTAACLASKPSTPVGRDIQAPTWLQQFTGKITTKFALALVMKRLEILPIRIPTYSQPPRTDANTPWPKNLRFPQRRNLHFRTACQGSRPSLVKSPVLCRWA